MLTLLVILSCSVLVTGDGAADCNKLVADMNVCNSDAFSDYKAAISAGDDGKPNWMARKSCNYMTVAVEDCTNLLLGDCYGQKEVERMKKQQLKGILGKMEKTVEEWDSNLCPLVRGDGGLQEDILAAFSMAFSKLVDAFSLFTD